jgi:GNAT superfamily N-acetyltransferase
MRIRTATPDDLDAVMRLLDGAMLETDRERTRRSIEAGETVVAVEDGRLLGATVAVPEEPGVRIDAVSVRRRRRGRGIGTALIESLVEEHDRVVAEFDERVRPFYESLEFEIEERGTDGRLGGKR